MLVGDDNSPELYRPDKVHFNRLGERLYWGLGLLAGGRGHSQVAGLGGCG